MAARTRRFILLASCALETVTASGASSDAPAPTPTHTEPEVAELCPSIDADQGVRVVFTAEVVEFETVRGMVRSSDLSEVVDDDGPVDGYIARLIDMHVDEVLSAAPGIDVAAGDTVTIADLGWSTDGNLAIILDGYPQVCEGDTALWSLTRARLSKGHFVHGIAEVYPVKGEKVARTDRDFAPVRAIEDLKVETLLSQARTAR